MSCLSTKWVARYGLIKKMLWNICKKNEWSRSDSNNMTVRKIHGSWWIDFRFERKRYRKKSPEDSRAGALAYEASLRHKLSNGESIDKNEEPKKENLKFGEFAWEWFDIYVMNNNKYSEVKMKKYILNKHLIPVFGHLSLDRISTHKVEKYKVKKDATNVSRKTINNQLTVLRKALRTAQEWGLLKEVPRIKLFKTPPVQFDFLSEKEADKLLSSVDGMWHEMILLALKTGMRLGELIALRWEHIDFKAGIITVCHSMVRNQLGSPKSNKIRYIPLADSAAIVLKKRAEKSGFLFTYRGRFLRTEYSRNKLHRICKQSGIRQIGWHMLRHSFASHLVQKNAPIKAIQELMGHADIQTTMRYTHLAPSVLKGTIDLLDSEKNFGQHTVNSAQIYNLEESGVKIILPNIKQKPA